MKFLYGEITSLEIEMNTSDGKEIPSSQKTDISIKPEKILNEDKDDPDTSAPCPPILAELHSGLHGREPNGRTRCHHGTSGRKPAASCQPSLVALGKSGRQPNHGGDQGWQEGRAGQESSMAAKRFPLLLAPPDLH